MCESRIIIYIDAKIVNMNNGFIVGTVYAGDHVYS